MSGIASSLGVLETVALNAHPLRPGGGTELIAGRRMAARVRAPQKAFVWRLMTRPLHSDVSEGEAQWPGIRSVSLTKKVSLLGGASDRPARRASRRAGRRERSLGDARSRHRGRGALTGLTVRRIKTATKQLVDAVVSSYTSYNATADALSRLVSELSETGGTVGGAAQNISSHTPEAGQATNEIVTAIADVAQGAEQQVQMIETVRGAVDEVRAAGQSSAEQAELTAQVADQAREVAREGVSAADRRPLR
jgi:hypothetical protein